MPPTHASTSNTALLGSVLRFNKNPWISAGENVDGGILAAKAVARFESSVGLIARVMVVGVGLGLVSEGEGEEGFVGVEGGVRFPFALLDDGTLGTGDLLVVVVMRDLGEDRGRSSAYMRSNSSFVCRVVADENATWWSTRPGRMSAVSRFSGWLVVIIKTRPSWDATPGGG